MRYGILVVTISALLAILILPGGYSLWERKMTITGNITVVEEPLPTPEESGSAGPEASMEAESISENSSEPGPIVTTEETEETRAVEVGAVSTPVGVPEEESGMQEGLTDNSTVKADESTAATEESPAIEQSSAESTAEESTAIEQSSVENAAEDIRPTDVEAP